MTKEEIKKYVDFSLNDQSGCLAEEDSIKAIITELFGSVCTFMIGHQPRLLTEEEIEANKTSNPNVISNIDSEDPYWTDDVGDIFLFDRGNPLHIYTNEELSPIDTDVLRYKGTIVDKEYELLVIHNCGFAVAYGPKEILDYVMAD